MKNFEKNFTNIYPEDHALEGTANQELYSPDGIEAYYQKSINSLKAQIMQLENYIKAKENEPALAAQVSEMMTSRPISGLTLAEKMNRLQNYERIIAAFENKNIPDEMLETTKATIADLKSNIQRFSELKDVAQNNPDLN